MPKGQYDRGGKKGQREWDISIKQARRSLRSAVAAPPTKASLKTTLKQRKSNPPRNRLWELEGYMLRPEDAMGQIDWIKERRLLVKCLAAYWCYGDRPDIYWLAENKPWVTGKYSGGRRFRAAVVLGEQFILQPFNRLESMMVAVWKKEGLLHESTELLADASRLVRV